MGPSSTSSARARLFERIDSYVQNLRIDGQASAALRVARLVFQCQHAALDARIEIGRDHGLTHGELFSLLLLRACYPDAPVTPTALREAVMLSSGGMAKVLRHLEERDLVMRSAHATDARSTTLVISDTGAELIDSIVPQVAERDREMFVGALTDAEVQELTRLLSKVRTAIRLR